MIRSFKHRGLKRFFIDGDQRGISQQYGRRLELILGRLDAATIVEGMNMPGYKLHPLKGKLKSFWSVTVSGNIRLIFRFDNKRKEAYDVDLVDYH